MKYKIKANVKKCFFAEEQRVRLFSHLTHFFLQLKKKRVVCFVLSNLVYNFLHHCGSRYLSCTSRRLRERIYQHDPKFIRTGQILNSCNISTRFGESSTPFTFNESAIGQHFLDNHLCPKITMIKNLLFFCLAVRLFICLL